MQFSWQRSIAATVGVAAFILLVSHASRLRAQTSRSLPGGAADPRSLASVLADPNAPPQARLNAYEQLAALGPAAKPALPTLMPLLADGGHSLPGREATAKEVAKLIGNMGPDAARSALGFIRGQLPSLPPGMTPRARWVEVVIGLGPAAHPALAEALGDKSEPMAELAAGALAAQIAYRPPPAPLPPALANIGPKLVLGWQRASNASFTPGPKDALAEQMDFQGRKPTERRREEWLRALYGIAQASGPKALDALTKAAEAGAKQKRPDPAAATAAVKELVRLAKLPPNPQGRRAPGMTGAAEKVRGLGAAAVAPLADVIATDPQARNVALQALWDLVGATPRSVAADPALARDRLLRGEPAPVLPLDPKNRAAVAKAVPSLAALVDSVKPQGVDERPDSVEPHVLDQTPSKALWLLIAVAPDVPAAAEALVARLPRLPEDAAPSVAEALWRSDKNLLKKVEAAAATGNPTAKSVAQRVRIRALPPKEAAAEILAMPLNERNALVGKLTENAGTEIVPLLIELLVDPRSGAADRLKNLGQYATPALVAALDRPEPAVRAAVLEALPNQAITPEIARKAAGMLGDEITAPPALSVLTKLGLGGLPLLVEQTQAKEPAARAHAAKALRMALYLEGSDAQVKAKVADAALALLDDPDPRVRTEALLTVQMFPEASRPALAARLKSSTAEQRQQLAQAIADQPAPSLSGWPMMDALIELVKKPADQGGGIEWRPGRSADEMNGLLIASLALDADPAVASAAEDVLIRADVAASDRALAERPPPTTQQVALIAKAKAEPDPKLRIDAIRQVANEHPRAASELLFAALDDASPAVRAGALEMIHLMSSNVTPRTPAAVAKLLEMIERDPSLNVREAAKYALDNLQRDRLPSILPRLRLMARSDDENERATAATVLGVFRDPHAQRWTPDTPPDRHLAMLLKLIEDKSPLVRRAAAIALAKYVRFDDPPQSPAAGAVVKLLEQPAALHPDAKAALLAVVPDLAAAGVELADHPDAEVQAAAALGLEQPPNSPPVQERRLTVAVATAALTSPVQRIRRMAAHSLLYEDPADPTRQGKGAQALLAASNDPNDAVAIDALDALVVAYCGSRVGPGETVWRQYPGFGEVGRLPTGFEVKMRKLMERTMSGAVGDRIAAINEIGGSGEPKLLAARWDAYIRLLQDPDPQIRAAAFSVARALTAAVVAKVFPNVAGAAPPPAPAPAPAPGAAPVAAPGAAPAAPRSRPASPAAPGRK